MHISYTLPVLFTFGYSTLIKYEARAFPFPRHFYNPVGTISRTQDSFTLYSSQDDLVSTEYIATEYIPSLGLSLRVGPSQVVPNQLGLFLESPSSQLIKTIPRGTFICRYSTGYFTDDCKSDKSVGFLYEGNGSDESTDLVMYQDQLMTVSSAIQRFCWSRKDCIWGNNEDDILWGHRVRIKESRLQSSEFLNLPEDIRPQPDFPWVFEPFDVETNPGGSFSPYSPSQLGKFANDLAFDPKHDGVASYIQKSNAKNFLRLVWRLEETTVWNKSSFDLIPPNDATKETTILVPSFPVVIAKHDLVIQGQEATEIGLEYGYHYWQAYLEKEEQTLL